MDPGYALWVCYDVGNYSYIHTSIKHTSKYYTSLVSRLRLKNFLNNQQSINMSGHIDINFFLFYKFLQIIFPYNIFLIFIFLCVPIIFPRNVFEMIKVKHFPQYFPTIYFPQELFPEIYFVHYYFLVNYCSCYYISIFYFPVFFLSFLFICRVLQFHYKMHKNM